MSTPLLFEAMFSSNAHLLLYLSFAQQDFEQTVSDRMTFHSSICSPNLSLHCEFVAPVGSSCRVKQAVNQPDPYATTFLRHQQVSTVRVCHSVPVCSASLPLGCWLLQGRHSSGSDIYRPEASWDSKYVCCCWTRTANCMHVSGNMSFMLRQHS